MNRQDAKTPRRKQTRPSGRLSHPLAPWRLGGEILGGITIAASLYLLLLAILSF